jgi:hypothetical protein
MAKNTRLAFFLGWLVPGAGHLYVGRRGKALLFFIFLMGTFLVGWALGHFRNVYFARLRFAILGQLGIGLPTILISYKSIFSSLGETFGRSASFTLGLGREEFFPLFDVGTIYTVIAGLLNFVVAINAYRLASHTQETPVEGAGSEK